MISQHKYYHSIPISTVCSSSSFSIEESSRGAERGERGGGGRADHHIYQVDSFENGRLNPFIFALKSLDTFENNYALDNKSVFDSPTHRGSEFDSELLLDSYALEKKNRGLLDNREDSPAVLENSSGLLFDSYALEKQNRSGRLFESYAFEKKKKNIGRFDFGALENKSGLDLQRADALETGGLDLHALHKRADALENRSSKSNALQKRADVLENLDLHALQKRADALENRSGALDLHALQKRADALEKKVDALVEMNIGRSRAPAAAVYPTTAVGEEYLVEERGGLNRRLGADLRTSYLAGGATNTIMNTANASNNGLEEIRPVGIRMDIMNREVYTGGGVSVYSGAGRTLYSKAMDPTKVGNTRVAALNNNYGSEEELNNNLSETLYSTSTGLYRSVAIKDTISYYNGGYYYGKDTGYIFVPITSCCSKCSGGSTVTVPLNTEASATDTTVSSISAVAVSTGTTTTTDTGGSALLPRGDSDTESKKSDGSAAAAKKKKKNYPRKTLYYCTFENCSYKTNRRTNLHNHFRTHTGEKPFACTYCDYASAAISNLHMHIKRRHKDIDQEFLI